MPVDLQDFDDLLNVLDLSCLSATWDGRRLTDAAVLLSWGRYWRDRMTARSGSDDGTLDFVAATVFAFLDAGSAA